MSYIVDTEERILEALLAMIVADGEVDPDELTQVEQVYAALTGEAIDPATLASRATLRLAADEPARLPPDLADGLDDEAKRRVLAAAYAVAEADGFVLEEEDQLLVRMTQALGLTEEVYRRAVSGLLSTAAS